MTNLRSVADFLRSKNMLQVPEEALWLAYHMVEWNVKTVLEIGTWQGGSAAMWAAIGAKVVTVDKNPLRERAGWSLLQDAGLCQFPDVIHIVADSQLSSTVDLLRRDYDLVFIDGDHTYEGVRRDWENYGPMGKCVAFHDIADWRVDYPKWGPAKLYKELKDQFANTIELVTTTDGCGIGVILK